MKKPSLILTSSAAHLADFLDKKDFGKVFFPDKNKDGLNYFPDKETYAKFSNLRGIANRIVVVHSGQPNPNDGLQELEITLGILKDAGKKNIEVFFTYFPYGMQDKIHAKGELNAAQNLIKKLIQFYKVKKIWIIDAHFWGARWTKKYPLKNISAVPLLMEAAKKDYSNILFLTPDKGGQKRTKIIGFSKKRHNSFEVEFDHDKNHAKNIKGKTIGVIDDLLETGGTLVKFKEKCLQYRAKEAVALITHGVLPIGIKKIKSNYKKLYLTNSISRPEANINIFDLIKDHLL